MARANVFLGHQCKGKIPGKVAPTFSIVFKVSQRDFFHKIPYTNLNGVTDFSQEKV